MPNNGGSVIVLTRSASLPDWPLAGEGGRFSNLGLLGNPTPAWIAAGFLPQLFRRFSQQGEGQFGGLGLSIAHHVVERHGGTIDAESDGEGQGATFRVTLPLLAG